MPNSFWFLFIGLIIFFVLWAFIQLARQSRKKSLDKATREQFSGYIKFLSSYEKASKAEDKGHLREALEQYLAALHHLRADKRKDKLVESNIKELENKISQLKQSLS